MTKFPWWMLLLAVWLGGCGSTHEDADEQRSAEKKSPAAPTPSPSPTSSVPATPDEVQLEKVSCEQWDQALAARRGDIVVVDTWATWCIPCIEEFPHLVALHGKYSPKGVACMSVSVDEPDQHETALAFLKQKQALFANYLIDDQPDAWFDKWNIKAIPIVLVFDRDGKLARKFDKDDPDNQFTYDDVEKLVTELLDR